MSGTKQNKFTLFSKSRIALMFHWFFFMSCGINGYFCPDHINNSSIPFRVLFLWNECQSLFYQEQKHCYPGSPLTTEKAFRTFILSTDVNIVSARCKSFFKFSCIWDNPLTTEKAFSPFILYGRQHFSAKSKIIALCRFLFSKMSIGKFNLHVSFSLGPFVSDKNI